MHRFASTAGWFVALSAGGAVFACSGCSSSEAGGKSAVSPPPNTQVDSVTAAGVASSAARPKPLPGAKTVVLARVGDRSYDKTFDDLRFEMKVGERFDRAMLSKEIETLHGQRIRIRGYILPTPQKHGITQFVLVRDNQECCFGPGAALYDCILVEMKSGKTADFTIRPIAVEGVFEIREFVIDGKHLAIYHLDAESAG